LKPDEVKLAGRLCHQLADALKDHQTRCDVYAACDDVYDATLHKQDSDRDSELHPPYAWQICETIVANIVDDQPATKIVGLTPDAEDQAENFEHLLRHQRNLDGFDEEWESFVQQAVVRPLTIGKVGWAYEVGQERRREWLPPMEMGGRAQEIAVNREVPIANHTSFMCVDAMHFWWDKAATSMRDAKCVYHRTFETRRALEALEKSDENPNGIYKNVKDIGKVESGAADDGEDARARDKIEVVEIWKKTSKGVRLYTIANRKVLIRDEPSPFHHAELPFVVASVSPRPFKFAGRGLAEQMADLQVALWQTLNHRRDATEVVANPAYEVPADFDADSVDVGSLYRTSVPGSIRPVNQPIQVISPLIEQENTLLRIMQDLTAANPAAAGTSDPEAIDSKTATEISLVQSAAQRRMMKMKRHMSYALRRVGRQQIKLIQQLLGAPETIRVTGDPASFVVVSPEDLQHRFDFEVENVAEAMNQQQRRAEATVLLQTAAGFAQVIAATDPEYRVSLAPLFKKFLTDYGVKADDVLVKLSPEELMAQQMAAMQQQMAAGVAGPPGGGGAAPPPPGSGAGAAPNFAGAPA
jgi:hypothetical protein